MKPNAAWATIILIVNLAINIAHGSAHDRLGVGLEPWQWAFVWIVILIAPIVAVALCWTRWRRVGGLLLGVSMLGSLLFGVYHHFLAVSSDHVSHLPDGDARGLFVATAILLVPAEASGAVIGFWNWNAASA